MDTKTLFSTSVTINAPPGHVWAIMSDIENWHLWTSSVTKVRRLDKGTFRVGSRALISQPKFPPALWRVTALEPERSFTWVSSAPGLCVTAHHSIEPVAAGSQVTLSVQYNGLFGSLFARLIAGITGRYLGFEAAGLKKRSEETYVGQ